MLTRSKRGVALLKGGENSVQGGGGDFLDLGKTAAHMGPKLGEGDGRTGTF